MSQLFQFKSATVPSIEYAGDEYLYIITNTGWTNIDIDTIDFGQLLDIVQKVNTGELYALRRTRLFDALDVKLGTDVSGNFAPTITGKTEEWDELNEEYIVEDDLRVRKISARDSKKQNIVSYNEIDRELSFDFEDIGKGGGFICITNVEPAIPEENVYTALDSSDGLVKEEIIVSNTNVLVTVLAITGAESLKPAWVRVNGQDVSLSMHTVENLWIGTIQLENCGDLITAEHAEGAIDECVVVYHPRPEVTSVVFVGDYPAVGQTHYHYDQNVTIEIESDSVIFGAETLAVDSLDALQPQSYMSENNDFTANTTIQVVGKTAYSNDGPSSGGVWVRVRDQYGAWSNPFFSDADNNGIDHVNIINLDSDEPQIVVSDIIYPIGQQALKADEQAEIIYFYDYTESLTVTALTSELNILTPTPAVGASIFVEMTSGTYNITNNNVRITGIKTSNDTSAYVDTCVYIANSAATIAMTGVHTSSRLRSGGNNGTSAQSYQVVVTSDQRLLSTPDVQPEPSAGVLSALTPSNVGTGQNFTGNIQVHDSITRNSYNFTLASPAVNLAGVETTTISSGDLYTIGGFVSRSGTFDAGVAYDDIGVNVSGLDNATKLMVTISAVSGTYAANTTNVNYSSGNHIFTVVSTGSPAVFDATGNALRINEANTVGANTTGLLPYTIEELA